MPTFPKQKKKKWIVETKQGAWTDSSFYNNRRWRKVRGEYIKLNPLCVHCKAHGIIESAKVCDHITPIRQGGDKWSYCNFQSLCVSCHNKKSSSESKQKKIILGDNPLQSLKE